MKVSRGFVAVTADQSFLYISTMRNGSGPAVVSISIVADVEDATIRQQPGPRDAREAIDLKPFNITWAPVRITREVELESAS